MNKSTLRGFYTLIATNVDTGEERILAEFENLLLDAGLNGIGTVNMILQCFVGTGSTPPVNSNNSMEHLLATTSNTSDAIGNDVSGGFGWWRRTFSFGAGVAAGNLSEIGVGNNSSLLFSRSLIKDGGGSPTTITVLSNEFFSVLYEIRLYPPAADSTFDVTIDSIVHHCVLRAAQVGTRGWVPYGVSSIVGVRDNQGAYYSGCSVYTGDIDVVTASPSGTEVPIPGALNAAAYSNNSLALAMATPVIPLDTANFDIKSLRWGTNMGTYQVSFTPPVTKDNTRTLMFNMSIAWARD